MKMEISHTIIRFGHCRAAVNMKNADFAEQKNADQKLQARCAVNMKIADQSRHVNFVNTQFVQPEGQLNHAV